jgi:hypothetical protein
MAEVVCPDCHKVRVVVKATQDQLCRRCAGKAARRKARSCTKCHRSFKTSTPRKRCPSCRTQREPNIKTCVVCTERFDSVQGTITCSPSCARRYRTNDTYFGGQLYEAEGWKQKECQICFKHVPRGYQVHHVYGHPNHTRLVILCRGCHKLVTLMARRVGFDEETFRRLIAFALMQRHGVPWLVAPVSYKKISCQTDLGGLPSLLRDRRAESQGVGEAGRQHRKGEAAPIQIQRHARRTRDSASPDYRGRRTWCLRSQSSAAVHIHQETLAKTQAARPVAFSRPLTYT